MKEQEQKFWNKAAGRYRDVVCKGQRKRCAYRRMLQEICGYLNRDMNVLELAAGPGILSQKIAVKCKSLEATDFSPEMIAEAKKYKTSCRLHFSVQDACSLPYAPDSFDAVVIANGLHIIPNPKLALENIRRVLKPDGILLCPTFTHETGRKNLWERVLELAGFQTCSRWSSEGFVNFLKANGMEILSENRIEGHFFPITFVAARKRTKAAQSEIGA